MKERSLVAFTVLSQLAVGAFWFWAASGWVAGRPPAAGDGWTLPALGAVLAVMLSALAASFLHLGAPSNAWRACSNLRSSWLSREILFASLFTGAVAALAALCRLDAGTVTLRQGVAATAVLLGALLLASMALAYRLRTVAAWNTWVTPVSFLGTALLLGSMGMAAVLPFSPPILADLAPAWRRALEVMALLLLGLQLATVRFWTGKLAANRAAAERASRWTRLLRVRVSLGVCGLGLLAALLGTGSQALAIAAFSVVLGSETVGRILFYEARAASGL